MAFDTARGRLSVVHGVSLSVRRGEILGLVGESGSGKSVTCLALLGLAGRQAVVSGDARLLGKQLVGLAPRQFERLRGRDAAMVFQEPTLALNPIMSIGQQIGEALRLNCPSASRASRAEVRERVIGLLREVGVPSAGERLDDYPHQLSGGLNQRVMIAMMLAGQPKLLIADEPTTALDVTIQAQILALLKRLRESRWMSIILITHDLGVVAQACDSVAVMYSGRVVEWGPVLSVFDAPKHPYTEALLRSRPDPRLCDGEFNPIPGFVPSLTDLPPGCAFAPRCSYAGSHCLRSAPPAIDAGAEHGYACFRLSGDVDDETSSLVYSSQALT